MRKSIGCLLMLVAGAIMLGGIVMAVLELGGLYTSLLDDALDQPEGMEEQAAGDMLRWVGLGATGLVPFLVGVFLYRGAKARQRRRTLRAS